MLYDKALTIQFLQKNVEIIMAKPSIEHWQTEIVRFSLMTKEPFSEKIEEWWKALTGSPPEEVTTRPIAGFKSVSSMIDDYVLELRTQFNRVDIIASPNPSISKELLSLGAAETSNEMICRRVAEWVEHSAHLPIIRLAFLPTFFRPVENTEYANSIISSYLGIPEECLREAKDLALQANFQKKSAAVENTVINRIAKFSSPIAQIMSIGDGIPVPQIHERHLCRAEIDINTDVDRTDGFTPREQAVVLRELITSAETLISKGWL
ncbi:hypothetical protein [Stenotrophomonas maltophilia]|uniref:Uncharacterized protein n=1 Tax=Stenotrophomonas maltophilia TaxID=40324 RepID=A0AAI9C603_STEMA|nr:hypothetical protein [Stenotrophomonas maltophilia]EKT4094625.1 hypothetical protein [Stenotrophomonas maltophilia]HEL4101986.1 hypothetical protein [Stenotrophomonas maltophilia]HEL5043172.1 hypothetical protein [Stenotrophomonas maltophilia]